MKISFLSYLFIILSFKTFAQQKKENPFKVVDVPDSIRWELVKKVYTNQDNLTPRTGLYIFNMAFPKDFVFKDGIYSVKGFGPHFPRQIFIFNKKGIYIFENEGTFNPKGVLKEFLKCIDTLGLNNKQVILYAKIISEYLQNEERVTYGAEIKN